jgi:hypothetical protein
VRELEENTAHLFLERRGETLTVKELRDCLLLRIPSFSLSFTAFLFSAEVKMNEADFED